MSKKNKDLRNHNLDHEFEAHNQLLSDKSKDNLNNNQNDNQNFHQSILEDEFKEAAVIAKNSDVKYTDQNLEKVYFPRSFFKKLIPALIWLLFILTIFTFSYWIAEDKENLLGAQFLIGAPFFIGAAGVYYYSLLTPITTSVVFKISFWLILGILLISIPILREGFICMVMAAPIIYIAILIGGLAMHYLCSFAWKSKALHSVAILPLLVIFLPLEQSPETYHVNHSVVINASPNQIWQSINHIKNIKPEEFYRKSRLLPFMQVPTPKSAITINTNGKKIRKCEWHGGITFDEPLISEIKNKQLRWNFVFHPDSVPPRTLDDHVTINGDHFKLLHGQYDIEPIAKNVTKLNFQVTYHITSNINSYAGFWGKMVMNEFVEDTLGLYKKRLESSNR